MTVGRRADGRQVKGRDPQLTYKSRPSGSHDGDGSGGQTRTTMITRRVTRDARLVYLLTSLNQSLIASHLVAPLPFSRSRSFTHIHFNHLQTHLVVDCCCHKLICHIINKNKNKWRYFNKDNNIRLYVYSVFCNIEKYYRRIIRSKQ